MDGINNAEVDQYSVDPKQAAVDGPGTADRFPALANLGSANKNGEIDEMAWAAMGREEVQDHLNDADKSDISAI